VDQEEAGQTAKQEAVEHPDKAIKEATKEQHVATPMEVVAVVRALLERTRQIQLEAMEE
jgi:hypothetical protein